MPHKSGGVVICIFNGYEKANIFPLKKKKELFLSDVYKHLVWFVLEALLNLIRMVREKEPENFLYPM